MRINLVEAFFQGVSIFLVIGYYLAFAHLSDVNTTASVILAVLLTGMTMYAFRQAGRVSA